MSYQPSRRPPYFDWRLDRWKIGLALLLWLGLILFPPTPPARLDPQGASPIARPGQRPLVGASTQTEPAETTPPPTDSAPTPSSTPSVRVYANEPGAKATDTPPLVSLSVWEPGDAPLRNSTPLFYGQTVADGLVQILIEGRRYEVAADDTGYWQYAPIDPLPVGMTWVQARLVNTDTTVLSPLYSHIALIGPDATPVVAPVILTALPNPGPRKQSTPPMTGIGPAGKKLLFYAQASQNGQARRVGETTVYADGTWSWEVTALLAGESKLWAVAVDDADTPLTRSWPVVRGTGP